jgi:hypothetical protein
MSDQYIYKANIDIILMKVISAPASHLCLIFPG